MKTKKLLSVLLTFAMIISLMPSVVLQAAATPGAVDYTITSTTGGEGGTLYTVGSKSNLSLADALAACTAFGDDGVLTIQLGDGNGTPLTIDGVSASTENALIAATYTGKVEIANPYTTGGFGLCVSSGVVTFEGLEIAPTSVATTLTAVYVASGATLNIIGSSSITNGGDNSRCVENHGTLNFSNSSLSASSSNSVALENFSTAAISQATTTSITSVAKGLVTSTGSTTDITGGTIESTGAGGSAVYMNGGELTVSNAAVNATGGGANPCSGIYCISGTVDLGIGAVVSCTAASIEAYAIHCGSSASSLTVNNGAKVTGEVFGIFTESDATSSITVSGGKISQAGSNGGTAIISNSAGNITVTGGTITSESGTGISNLSTGTLTITNGYISGAGCGAYASAGTVNLNGGTVECTGINIQNFTGTGLDLNGTAKAVLTDGAKVISSTMETIRLGSGGTSQSANVFEKTVYGNPNAKIVLTGVASSGKYTIDSTNYTNAAAIASSFVGSNSFGGWTNASGGTATNTTNGDIVSNIAPSANDIYLVTGLATKVSLDTALTGCEAVGNTISGLTIGTAYKLTMGSIVYYTIADGYLTTNAADCKALTVNAIMGLIIGSTYKLEAYTVYSFSGKVFPGTTNVTVEGLTVNLYSSDNPSTAVGSDKTDMDGNYEISGVTAGEYYASVAGVSGVYSKSSSDTKTVTDASVTGADITLAIKPDFAITSTEVTGTPTTYTYDVVTALGDIHIGKDSLAEAFALCTEDQDGDSVITIKLGTSTASPLCLKETQDPTSTSNVLSAATYTGWVQIKNPEALPNGFGLLVPSGNVTLDGLAVTSDTSDASTNTLTTVDVKSGATLNIKGSSSISTDGPSSKCVVNLGTLNFSGGAMKNDGLSSMGIYNAGKLNITGGEILSVNSAATGAATGVYNLASAEASISNCTITNSSSFGTAFDNYGKLTVTQGTNETTKITSPYVAIAMSNGTTTNINGGTVESTGAGGSAVNMNGGTLYVSKATVIATGGANADAECSGIYCNYGTVVLDDGAEISNDSSHYAAYPVYCGSSSNATALTVKTGAKITGLLYGIFSLCDSHGTITVSGGEISQTGSFSTSAIKSNSSGAVTITGGKITSTNGYGVSNTGTGTVDITNAEISGGIGGVYAYDGTVTMTSGTAKGTGATGAAFEITNVAKANISTDATLISSTPETIRFRLLNSTSSQIADVFGKKVHGNPNAKITLTGVASDGTYLIDSSSYEDAVVSATSFKSEQSFAGWTSDSLFANILLIDGINAPNGAKLSTLDSTSIYLKTGTEAVVKLADGSTTCTAGDSKITGLTSGTAYKVTMGSAVYYTKGDGTLSTNVSDAAALSGTTINGLSNGSTYKVEAYTTYSISGKVSAGTTGASVSGLTVNLYSSSNMGTVMLSTKTDANGNYVITAVPTGTYCAAVEAVSGVYAKSTSNLITVTGANVTTGADITLAVEPDYTITSIPVMSGSTITGYKYKVFNSEHVSVSGDCPSLAVALAGCGTGKTIMLGGGPASPLKLVELNSITYATSSTSLNDLISATYTGNVEVTDSSTVADGSGLYVPASVTAVLEGLTVTTTAVNTTAISMLSVRNNGTLQIKQGSSIIADTIYSRGIINQGTVNVSGGSITSAGEKGFGISDGASTSVVNVSGGSISASGSGGCAVKNINSFTMTGGEISSTGTNASGLVSSGTAVISDGKIRSDSTGGVPVTNLGNGNMTISDKANISTVSSYAVMSSGNAAHPLKITGGTITATGVGGTAVYINYGKLDMTGGTVSAAGDDSKPCYGILNSFGTVNISGGSVTYKGTNTNGYAIYQMGTQDSMQTGTVALTLSDNAVVSGGTNGNGIYSFGLSFEETTVPELTVSGTASVTGNNFGINNYCTNDDNKGEVKMTGGTVTATGDSGCALMNYGDAVISDGSLSSTGASGSAVSLATNATNCAFAISGAASLSSASSNTVLLSKLSDSTYTESASIAGRSIYGCANADIIVKGGASGSDYAINAKTSVNVAVIASNFSDTTSFAAWTSDSALEKSVSTTNGARLLSLNATDIYLKTGTEKVVKLDTDSLGTAGDSTITVDTNKIYKVTVDNTTYYVKADGTLSSIASECAALKGIEIIGLSNDKSYLVEEYTAGGGSGGSSSYTPTTDTGAKIEVGGKTQTAGTVDTKTQDGKTTTTVTISTNKLKDILESSVSGATVTIPITTGSNTASGKLDGQAVKDMEKKAATLVIDTGSASYTLPASDINIDSVSEKFGNSVSLSDIAVNVSISSPSDATAKVVKDSAASGGFSIQVPAVEFTVSCTYNGKTIEVSAFNSYVERMIAIPDGVDPKKITTGIVVKPDGSTHHVPTEVIIVSGKYFAKINSLTNSVYSVIYNPVEFSDAASHWAKASINNMGSRMVINGVGNNNYDPDRSITRAEMASIMVKALGLEPGTGKNSFNDVNGSAWYCGYIETASTYGIIKGYDFSTFGPNNLITREQAMSMIARAMKLTGLEVSLTNSDISGLLTGYTDTTSFSDYAKDSIAACLKTGIVSGTSKNTISPKNYVTRAEVAVMVERLLQKSQLI